MGEDSFANQGRLDSDWRHFGLSCGGRGQAATAPGVEVRDAAGCPLVHRTAPPQQRITVSSAEAENLCLRLLIITAEIVLALTMCQTWNDLLVLYPTEA